MQLGKHMLPVEEHPLHSDHHLYAQVAPTTHLCQGAFGSRLIVKATDAMATIRRQVAPAATLPGTHPANVKTLGQGAGSVRYMVAMPRSQTEAKLDKQMDEGTDALAKEQAKIRQKYANLDVIMPLHGGKMSTDFLEDGYVCHRVVSLLLFRADFSCLYDW